MSQTAGMLGRLSLAVLALLTVACGGDSGGDDPEGFTYEAARACSDVLNERDGDEFLAGQDASFDVLLWTMEGEQPTDDERAAAADAIDAYRAELIRTRDELADLDAGDDAAAWDDYLALFDAPLDGLATRADQARTGDGEPRPGDVDVDGEQLTAVLEDLELVGRDCETLFSTPGPIAEHRDFLVATTEACTTIVSRRRAADHLANTEVVLDAVAATVQDEPVEPTDELAGAVDSLITEWEATADDFGQVPADGAPEPEEWAATVATAEERIEIYEARAAALDSGDDGEVTEAFGPGAGMDHPGFGDLQALGLDRRDCRSVEP